MSAVNHTFPVEVLYNYKRWAGSSTRCSNYELFTLLLESNLNRKWRELRELETTYRAVFVKYAIVPAPHDGICIANGNC